MKSCVLLSGGMDSIAVCYWHRPELAITVDYGQAPAQAEITAATQVAERLNIEHTVIRADCSQVGLGEMLGGASKCNTQDQGFHPPTIDWWPFRNQLLVTLAAAHCVVHNVDRILLGSVKTDALHKDGLPKFYEILNQLVSFQEGSLSVDAPAINMMSVELIRLANVPLSLLGWAHSCHSGDLPCGKCRGCIKYREVWQTLQRG